MGSFVKELLSNAPIPTSTFLQQEKDKYPQHLELLDEIEDLYSKKLYHQFTNKLEIYLKLDDKSGNEVASIIYHVIFPLKMKLSQMRSVALVDYTAAKLSPADGLLLIDEFEPAMTDTPEAMQRLHIVKANTLVRLGDLPAASEILLTQLASQLENQIGVDIAINAAYHEARANYFRAAADPKLFYESILLYLAYTPLNCIPPERQTTIAFELAVAGLVADGMMDFGDLLVMPILTTLDAKQSWIMEFIKAATEGSLLMFEKAMERYGNEANAAFGGRMSELHLKMTLSSLVDITFKLPATDRRISFDAIATHCKISSDQCERLLMKAMSFGLIKGRLDGIENQLTVDWVKPRMVDSQRIDLIRDRFANWKESVKRLGDQLENSMPELLAA